MLEAVGFYKANTVAAPAGVCTQSHYTESKRRRYCTEKQKQRLLNAAWDC